VKTIRKSLIRYQHVFLPEAWQLTELNTTQHYVGGHSDNVLEYYLEKRGEIAEKLRSADEIDSEVERSFFSYLLLASAFIEELTTETVLSELFREEARLNSITEHVRSMGHAERLEKLCDIQILTGGDHGSLVEVKERRNKIDSLLTEDPIGQDRA